MTVPFPYPLSPEVIEIQLALLSAFQPHLPCDETLIFPVPPETGKEALGDREYVQVIKGVVNIP